MIEPPASPAPGVPADVDPVIAATITAFRNRAFHEVSLLSVAADVDLPISVVLQRFPTWDGLLGATVRAWNGSRMGPLLPIAERHGAVAFLRGIVVANIADPALMRVLVAIINIAATPGHPMAAGLRQQWRQFHAMVAQTLARDVALGREPAAMDPRQAAEQLIALYEGLQLQSMVRPEMDLLAAYDSAVEHLRAGWSAVEPAPADHVWTI